MATGYERLQANQAMQMGRAQGRMGLLDLFPALGQWVQGNRDALMQPYQARANQQADSLLGAPAASAMQTGADGLTSGVSTQGSGLLAAPDDYANKMRYAQGLMGTPGYEAAGLQFMNQAVAHQTGADSRAEGIRQWKAEQAQRAEIARKQLEASQARHEQTMEATQQRHVDTQTSGMFNDNQKILKPLRTGIQLYDNVQSTIREKGFTGMNVTDDVVLTKTLAKLLLPEEAVMEGDLSALMAMDGIDANTKAFLQRTMGLKTALNETERKQLYDQIQQIGAQRLGEYEQTRADLQERETELGYGKTMLTQLNPDRENYNPAEPKQTEVTPELAAKLDAKAEAQDPSIWPEITAPQWWTNWRK